MGYHPGKNRMRQRLNIPRLIFQKVIKDCSILYARCGSCTPTQKGRARAHLVSIEGFSAINMASFFNSFLEKNRKKMQLIS
jgi:hypothetical protein